MLTDIFRIINEVAGLKEILQDLKDLAENSQTASADNKVKCLEALAVHDGPLDICAASLKNLEVKLGPIVNPGDVIGRLAWPLREKTVQNILSTIEKQKAAFILALATDGVRANVAIRENVADIQKVVRGIKEDGSRAEIVRWLSSSDPSSNHNAACNKREPQTGNWLIASDEFSD
jgi:hypothetical protein